MTECNCTHSLVREFFSYLGLMLIIVSLIKVATDTKFWLENLERRVRTLETK